MFEKECLKEVFLNNRKKVLVLFGIILSVLTYGYDSVWLVCFLLPVSFLNRYNIIIWSFTFSLLSLITCLGIHKFELFTQVRYFIHLDILSAFYGPYFVEKSHVLRFLVASPCIILSKITLQDIDMAYTLYCILLTSVMSVVFREIFCVLHNGKNVSISILAALVFCIISIFMNGRMIPAYFGFSIVLWRLTNIFSYYKKNEYLDKKFITIKELSIIFIGWFFTAVSSGTMLISFTLILISFFFMIFMFKKANYTVMSKIFIFIAVMFVGLFSGFMILRNFIFFQDRLFGLLEHGLGRFLIHPYIFVVLAFIVPSLTIAFLALISNSLKNKPALIAIILAIPISVFLGIFGFSTLSMIIVPGVMFWLSTCCSLKKHINDFIF